MKQGKKVKVYWGMAFIGSLLGVLSSNPLETEASNMLGGPSHLGTFEGSTTFTTSSSNGINPGLYLEVMDEYGNYHEYTSEEGVITVPNTQEGAYVTQAKLLGKTKYRDQDTGELLDEWEAGRNLTLESVEEPGLTTMGKNLFDINNKNFNFDDSWFTSDKVIIDSNNISFTINYQGWGGGFIYKNDGTEKVISLDVSYSDADADQSIRVVADGVQLSRQRIDNGRITNIKIPKGSKVIKIQAIGRNNINNKVVFSNIQVEQGSVSTPYESYKSNILTANDDVTLRGIGNVKDEMDCLTGEVTERIDEIVLDGSEDWIYGSTSSGWANGNDSYAFYSYDTNKFVNKKQGGVSLTNKFTTHIGSSIVTNESELGFSLAHSNYVVIRLRKEQLADNDPNTLKQWLQVNPITVQYQLKTESTKTVRTNSTYHFKPVNTRAVYVDGTVVPLVCSVTVPTEPLSFVLNPNEEPGKQFIAPEFTIENNNPASLSVSLKEFKQVTTVFNDVLPNQHQDWSQLDQEQSKDLALALVPKVSDGWKQLNEGPRYVVDSTNEEIGEIKPKASVDFTFSASHGPAFTQALSPRYRLVFVFDF